MMPAPTSLGRHDQEPGLFLMVLPPNAVSLDRIARVRVRDGKITDALTIEREPWNPFRPKRKLHWVEGIGSWEEV